MNVYCFDVHGFNLIKLIICLDLLAVTFVCLSTKRLP